MNWKALSLSRAARHHRKTRRHLLTWYDANHRMHTLEALGRGVPMGLIVALHDADTDTRGGTGTCGFTDSGFNQAVRAVSYLVARGGNPDHVLRYLRAMQAQNHRDPVGDTRIFAKQADRAMDETSAWAKSRDWVEEAVVAAEQHRYFELWTMLPTDMRDKYHPGHDEWQAILYLAQVYDLDVPDLAQHIPAMLSVDVATRDVRGHLDIWRRPAGWQKKFGTERTSLMLAAGLSEDEGYECEASNEDLAVLVALMQPA